MSIQKKDKYTISDVAQMLGVSRSTISRAMNNSPGVGEELRKKVLDFVEETSAYPHIHVAGLMAIPPICDQISDLEDYFDRMYQLFLDIGTKKIDNVSMDLLSMGMSGDYLTAIRHGSNMVRLGTANFGKRNY